MRITDLLTTYWSQLTMVLFGFGYVVKNILETISKKREINHSLFQQNKIDAIRKYLSQYAKVELMWIQLPIYNIFKHEYSAKNIDEMIFPKLNILSELQFEINLYLENEEAKYFEIITENSFEINRKLLILYSFPEKGYSSCVDEYNEYRNKILATNKSHIKECCAIVRKKFKS